MKKKKFDMFLKVVGEILISQASLTLALVAEHRKAIKIKGSNLKKHRKDNPTCSTCQLLEKARVAQSRLMEL